MQLTRCQTTEHRKAYAWYVRFACDFHAIGPYRFSEMVTADVAIAAAEEGFKELPTEVWPDGRVEEVDEYPIELAEIEEDDDDSTPW